MADYPVEVPITDSWTAVTAPNQKGTIWLGTAPESGHIAIAHSDSGSPAGLDKRVAMEVQRDDSHPFYILNITPNSVTDVFYCICTVTGETGSVFVDVR